MRQFLRIAKTSTLTRKSRLIDGTSTLDMAFSALNIIKKLQFPMVLLENVPNFGNSDIYRMWDLQLRRMGYQTYSAVLDARDHGGYTCRKRFFHFATSLPLKFEWPCAEKRNEECLYEKFVSSRLEDFRDVSHTKSAQLSEGSGRSNYLSKGSTYTKMIMKSSARQQKDALYIHEEGSDKYLWPDGKLIQDLMTVPDSYNLDIVTDEVAKEILGQGVDGGLFESIMVKIKEHIKSFLEGDQRLAYC
ncbi:DNA cytosine methyltransferase [Photobacterium leiognathi]|uniref:DNA cytosine methyltransferase n=1 Tax=Photobacterium leiognathi TaxID=553611 RepID=UPI001EDD9982|nr:DNA cytosine methyltransferase [Photobacterium leiognathi]MCG3884531.1 DNA cytosine methyltransferase [Photobacterium leiognathi]